MPGLAAQAVLGPASLAMAAHCMENAVACNVSGQAKVEGAAEKGPRRRRQEGLDSDPRAASVIGARGV